MLETNNVVVLTREEMDIIVKTVDILHTQVEMFASAYMHLAANDPANLEMYKLAMGVVEESRLHLDEAGLPYPSALLQTDPTSMN